MPPRSLTRPARWALLVGAVVAATGLAAAPGWAAGRAPQPSAGLVVEVLRAFPAPRTGPLTCAGGAPSSADGAYTSVLTLTFDTPVGGWSRTTTGTPVVPCPCPATS